MAERKEIGPISGIWTGIKSHHKALNNGSLFKPDVAPVLKNYDQGLINYTKLAEDKKKLGTLINEFKTKVFNERDISNRLADERDKVDAKTAPVATSCGEQLTKCLSAPEIDFASAIQALGDYATAKEDSITTHKLLTDRMFKHNSEMATLAKKTRDELKSKFDAMTSGEKKLQADADKFVSQIRQIVATYEKIAADMDHEEIIAAVRTLIDGL